LAGFVNGSFTVRAEPDIGDLLYEVTTDDDMTITIQGQHILVAFESDPLPAGKNWYQLTLWTVSDYYNVFARGIIDVSKGLINQA
jgi:hypothetical protein